jgi:hypothetical protein
MATCCCILKVGSANAPVSCRLTSRRSPKLLRITEYRDEARSFPKYSMYLGPPLPQRERMLATARCQTKRRSVTITLQSSI